MIKDTIGIDAGVVWKTLAANGMMSIKEIGKMTKIASFDLGMAIGWLARENKVNLILKEEGELYAELIDGLADIYY